MTYADDYLTLIKNNPVKIAHELGYTKLTDIHNEWIKKFIFAKEDYLLQAHRGSYKTTCLDVAVALLMVTTPNDNILVQRKTDDDIKAIIGAVSKILQHPVMLDLVYNVWGVGLKIKASQTEASTNLMTFDRGTSQLVGMGVNGSLTGKHFERIFTDDIINLKDRISEAERKHTKLVYQELQNLRNRGGIIGNTGTPWHKEDAFTLMPKAEVYDCYQTGLISKQELQNIRQNMTPSLFAANYELKHIADENALFTNPLYTRDVKSLYNGICHIDAGYGGDDFTAFTIMKACGDKAVAFGKMWSKHVDECLEEILLLREKYLGGNIYGEDNADKGYLAKAIRSKATEMGKKGLLQSAMVTVKRYHEAMNKDVKIKTHLYTKWRDISWLDTTDPEYLSQILDYTEDAAHDDSPDSASSASRILFNKKPLKIKPGWEKVYVQQNYTY